MKHFILSTIVILVLTSFSTIDESDLGWSVVRNNDHIKVYKKPTETGYNAIKIQATISTPIKKFISLVNDVERYPDWVFKCSEAVRLEDPSNTTLKYWMVSDFPFPFKDRELTVESSHHIDQDGVFHSTSKAIPNLIDSSNIAITQFDAHWTVTPSKKNQINIEYEIMAEPGGAIPAWLYNLAVDQGPFKTMQNLKDILENQE
jgi:ribosome-associated toxin RatA of RatAB toxin-antitoxin module